MKTKTKTFYIATDGREFTDKAKCEQYEADGCVEFEPLPGYGDHFPLTERDLRWMLSGDGDCCYATATKMSLVPARCAPHPDWATHLIYFGK